MKALTKRQTEVLTFIQQFLKDHGYPPTMREIGAHLSISVKASFDHIQALRKKGILGTNESRSRALEIIDESYLPAQHGISVPVIGHIAAGQPVLAEEHFERMITLPAEMLKMGSQYYALSVEGDSMINAGILEGDLAVIKYQNQAENGEIVAARVNDEAVTLKRFFRENNRVRLQPENPEYPPMYTQEVQILGTLQMIIRDYP